MWRAPITPPCTHIRRGAVTPDTCHGQDRQTGRDMYCTHLQTHTQYAHIYSLPLSLSLLLSPALSVLFLCRSDFHVQGQYQLSTGNITPSYPEHDKRTNAVPLRTKGKGDVLSSVCLFISHWTSFVLSPSYCLMISVSKTE